MTTCRLLPQGVYPLIPTLLTTMAWLASLFQDDCDYSRVTGDIVEQLALSPDVPWLEVGIQGFRQPRYVKESDSWQVTLTGQCLVYDPEYLDTSNDPFWKASKAFSFLALVLGGGGTFFLWFSTCCTFSRGTWRWAGYEVLLAAIFQACSFVFFQTELCRENTCELFWGSRTDIMGAVFWFVAALCIFCYYPPPQDVQDEEEADGIMVGDSGSGSQHGGGQDDTHYAHDLQLSLSYKEEEEKGLPPSEEEESGHETTSAGQASQQEGPTNSEQAHVV